MLSAIYCLKLSLQVCEGWPGLLVDNFNIRKINYVVHNFLKSKKVFLLKLLILIVYAIPSEAKDKDKNWFFSCEQKKRLEYSNLGVLIHASSRYAFKDENQFYEALGKNIFKHYEKAALLKHLNREFKYKHAFEKVQQEFTSIPRSFGGGTSGDRILVCNYKHKKRKRGIRRVLFANNLAIQGIPAIALPVKEIYNIHPNHPLLLIGRPISQCPATLPEAKSIVRENFSGVPCSVTKRQIHNPFPAN